LLLGELFPPPVDGAFADPPSLLTRAFRKGFRPIFFGPHFIQQIILDSSANYGRVNFSAEKFQAASD
jgi:hypothetical protein